MYNMSMLRHRFSNERGGGGGVGRTTFLSYSVTVCIFCKGFYAILSMKFSPCFTLHGKHNFQASIRKSSKSAKSAVGLLFSLAS